MVKKSGILDKLVGRFRSGSVRVESEPAERQTRPERGTRKASTGSGTRSAAPNRAQGGGERRTEAKPKASAPQGRVEPQPVEAPRAVPVKHVPEEIIPSSRRKLSAKENAQLTIDKSFQELSSLLKGVDRRMGDQSGKLDQVNENLAKLPVAAQQQIDLLQALVTQMDKQNSMNGKMVETFAELPQVLKGVQDSLAKTAATDERTSKTLDDFKSTMDRIQGSMGEMVSTSKEQAEAVKQQSAASTAVAGDHRDTVKALQSATSEGLEALRRAQEDQANRMAKIASENGRSNRVVVVLLILSFAAMVAILVSMVVSR